MLKTETMKIRLSEQEKQTFEKAAELSGIAVSAWMRDRLRRAARRELQDANQAVPFLRDVEHG
jgi:uncharacterized protein (DUF1778 family)